MEKNGGWTIHTLKEHFETLLAEKDKAVNIALNAAKEAVAVAEKNAEKWRDNANEWRGAMNDRENTFVAKSEFTTYKEGVDKAMIAEKERGDKGAGRIAGISQFIGWIVAAVAILGFIIKYLSVK